MGTLRYGRIVFASEHDARKKDLRMLEHTRLPKRQKHGTQVSQRKEAQGTEGLFHNQKTNWPSSEESGESIIRARPRIALVHDWLNGMRGGEIVFEALLDLFPEAEIFTLIYEPEKFPKRFQEKLAKRKVHTSFLNRFFITRKYYRHLLPILPFVVSTLKVSEFDLVISSSHCVAKGVKKGSNAFHLSYLHAPMRYMWDRFEDYFGAGKVSFFVRLVAKIVRPFLQIWDAATSQENRIDLLACNSNFIRAQIKKHYGREAVVVYPFAKLERFQKPRKPGNFYLMVGAFAPYKQTDVAIEAFARMGLPLKIVGSGQDEQKLKDLKKKLNASNVDFLGSVSFERIEQLYSECRAFIFPGVEDFGITPLEAMAAGSGVIALGEGGACETVVNGKTGLWFYPKKTNTKSTHSALIEALCEAVMEVESGRVGFQEAECRARAQFFTEERFKKEILSLLSERGIVI